MLNLRSSMNRFKPLFEWVKKDGSEGRTAETAAQIRNRAEGFTLLEILIVLFIAMLMLGMGIVGFAGRLPAAKLDATAREMSALIRQARLLAKTELEKQAFVVDMDERRYGIEGKTLRQIPEEVHVRVDDSMSGPRDQGNHRMIFSPFGGVSGGTIEMTTGRRGISLKADPILGVQINRTKQE